MADDFFSFEEALDELRLKEEELKRLVSEGEIRAFRDGETMKLRRSDVESLRSELSGGEVVDLGDASEELVFEDDTDLDAGMATEEISSADTILEADVEDVGEVELEEEDDFDEPAPAAAPARRRSAPAAMAADDEDEGALMKAVLILTSLVLILAIPVIWSAARGVASPLASGIAGVFDSSLKGN